MTIEANTESFSQLLLAWFDAYGRKDLPWQNPRHPYTAWLSEIMLQQTQVLTVIPYFLRFIERFPSVYDLALADDDEVLSLWSGLGYYSRARNLHRCAKIIAKDYDGKFPKSTEELIKLPGIGASTAAAIASQAFNLPAAILDGNVKRVLARYFQIKGYPQQSKTHNELLTLAERCLPTARFTDYTQAIMDLGALCCRPKKPSCNDCPLQSNCLAFNNNVVQNFPEKKPKKALETKHQQFLLLHRNDEKVYLEKRPPVGLWGGLWCLPSLDDSACPLQFIGQHYDMQGTSPRSLISFKHSFSHFHLKIHAKSIRITDGGHQLHEINGGWFSQDQLQSLGLAKPVSLILEQWNWPRAAIDL